MIRLVILWILAVLAICLLSIVSFIPFADSHEGHGFKHMAERSGPIIKAQHCGTGHTLWSIDYDEDNIVDACKLIFFYHNKIHVKEIPLVEGGCECPEQ